MENEKKTVIVPTVSQEISGAEPNARQAEETEAFFKKVAIKDLGFKDTPSRPASAKPGKNRA